MVARRPRSYVKTLSSLSRIKLLHELQEHGATTVTELAAATGLHHNTVREHMHRLIDAGFVRSQPIPRTTKGRPKVLYRAATQADDPVRNSRRVAAKVRAEHGRKLIPFREVRLEPDPLDRQIDILDDHMQQCGFEAVLNADATHMTIHECPLSDLARDHPQVCEVHFALIKDALELEDGPLTALAQHPFSAPGACTVHLVHDASEAAASRPIPAHSQELPLTSA